MKIAVASTGPTLDDAVEARFGRCAYFLIIEPDTMAFEAIANPNVNLGGGAGPQSAKLMADKGVSIVLAGNCGPKAMDTFGAVGIQVVTGISGQVRQAAQNYKAGASTKPSSPALANQPGSSMGAGLGMGSGRGMGGGCGTGSGRGMGRGMGSGKGCGRRFR